MTEFAVITLENEMDLTLAYKRSIITAGMLGLTIATQTAFATAVSEVCREVIDKAINGIARLGAVAADDRFFIAAEITATTDKDFKKHQDGFEYARKLLPVVDVTANNASLHVLLKLGIPRSTRVDKLKISAVKRQIDADGPVSAYEEVKLRNRQLNTLNQQQESALEEAKTLNEQKNEFLSVASHELNSPLTVLRSFTQIAQRVAGEGEGPIHKALAKIDQQSAKLINLVRQLMDITKLERGVITYDKQTTGFTNFLRDAFEASQLLVPNHKLHFELGDTGNVSIDHLRMEQVLSNLIGNAAKYSQNGSDITVKTAVNGHQLVCEIHDQGMGMSEETQRMVFEKFYRAKGVEKKYSGLGMGLYITSRIINDHGGSIKVSSVPDQGSVFSFTLPLLSA